MSVSRRGVPGTEPKPTLDAESMWKREERSGA